MEGFPHPGGRLKGNRGGDTPKGYTRDAPGKPTEKVLFVQVGQRIVRRGHYVPRSKCDRDIPAKNSGRIPLIEREKDSRGTFKRRDLIRPREGQGNEKPKAWRGALSLVIMGPVAPSRGGTPHREGDLRAADHTDIRSRNFPRARPVSPGLQLVV